MTPDERDEAALPPGAAALGYAGLLPFVAGALRHRAARPASRGAFAARALLCLRGVILSFWARCTGARTRARGARRGRAAAAGVLPSLAGWVALAAARSATASRSWSRHSEPSGCTSTACSARRG